MKMRVITYLRDEFSNNPFDIPELFYLVQRKNLFGFWVLMKSFKSKEEAIEYAKDVICMRVSENPKVVWEGQRQI